MINLVKMRVTLLILFNNVIVTGNSTMRFQSWNCKMQKQGVLMLIYQTASSKLCTAVLDKSLTLLWSKTAMCENVNDIHLQMWAWSEDDQGGDGHGEEEYQKKQTVDHQSNLVGGQIFTLWFWWRQTQTQTQTQTQIQTQTQSLYANLFPF